jgi:CRISPR/Cas system-associated endonuclease/helicase Cas3
MNLTITSAVMLDHIFGAWDKMSSQWYENLDELNEEWRKICEFIHRNNSVLSLGILSDNIEKWLDRDDQTKYFSLEQREHFSLLRGLTITADHIASSGSNTPAKIPNLYDYNFAPSNAYSYQIQAGKKVGNLILTSPTGSGKTEAALLWAQINQKENGRLFYTLPTTASLNAMYIRLRNIFNDADRMLVGLLHSRVANSFYSMLEGSNNGIHRQHRAKALSSLAREMYFPIRVCTPHQILRFTLFGKGWEMMLSEFPQYKRRMEILTIYVFFYSLAFIMPQNRITQLRLFTRRVAFLLSIIG